MSGPINPRPLIAAGRDAHLGLMTDACTITRDGTATLDRTTSALTPGPVTTLYAGACRVKSQRLPRDRQAGERLTVAERYDVMLPFKAVAAGVLQVGDILTVTASDDVRLVGQALAVRAIDFGSLTTSWRLSVEDFT